MKCYCSSQLLGAIVLETEVDILVRAEDRVTLFWKKSWHLYSISLTSV